MLCCVWIHIWCLLDWRLVEVTVSQGFSASHKNTGYREKQKKRSEPLGRSTRSSTRMSFWVNSVCLLLTLPSSLRTSSVRRWMSAIQKCTIYNINTLRGHDKSELCQRAPVAEGWQLFCYLLWCWSRQRGRLPEHPDHCTFIKPPYHNIAI